MTVEYPQSLSRGLVLVKWWLLALPQYLVVGVFAGGGWAPLDRLEQPVVVAFRGVLSACSSRLPG